MKRDQLKLTITAYYMTIVLTSTGTSMTAVSLRSSRSIKTTTSTNHRSDRRDGRIIAMNYARGIIAPRGVEPLSPA